MVIEFRNAWYVGQIIWGNYSVSPKTGAGHWIGPPSQIFNYLFVMDTLIRDMIFAVVFGAVGGTLFITVCMVYWWYHHRKKNKGKRD